jgi:hypothetical protein
MKNKITETDWENVIDAEVDINSACSNFTETFLNIAKTCIPTREVTMPILHLNASPSLFLCVVNFFLAVSVFFLKNICRSLSRLSD